MVIKSLNNRLEYSPLFRFRFISVQSALMSVEAISVHSSSLELQYLDF